MPYENGKRISMEEWTRLHSTKSEPMATSERGVAPGGVPLEEEVTTAAEAEAQFAEEQASGSEAAQERAAQNDPADPDDLTAGEEDVKRAQEDPSVASDSPEALEESDAIREKGEPVDVKPTSKRQTRKSKQA